MLGTSTKSESETMTLNIGQVAAAAAVNIQTIRYYERRGLFTTPRRLPSGYRQYAQDAVTRLRFIKHAQVLGFSLKEIQELLALRVRHGAACDTVERRPAEDGARGAQDPGSRADQRHLGATRCSLRVATSDGRLPNLGGTR